MKKKSWKWVMTRLMRYRMRFEQKDKLKFKFSNPLIFKLTGDYYAKMGIQN